MKIAIQLFGLMSQNDKNEKAKCISLEFNKIVVQNVLCLVGPGMLFKEVIDCVFQGVIADQRLVSEGVPCDGVEPALAFAMLQERVLLVGDAIGSDHWTLHEVLSGLFIQVSGEKNRHM